MRILIHIHFFLYRLTLKRHNGASILNPYRFLNMNKKRVSNATVTADQLLVKEINKTLIFDAIRQNSPISRAELGKKLGLVKGTVSSLVAELIEQKFVDELGLGCSSGGRKPIMLRFNYQAGYAIGIHIQIDKIQGIIADLNGAVVVRRQCNFTGNALADIYKKLKTLINTLIKLTPESEYGVIGIGISCPGLINEFGDILFSPSLNWKEVSLLQYLKRDFSLPIEIYNEAKAGAMGEVYLGLGKAVSNLVYVSIESGIGTGIVINNELYLGAQGLSGESGHTIICYNGEYLNWQQLASTKAIVKQALAVPALAVILSKKSKETNFQRLLQLANENHPQVLALFHDTGTSIGLGLVNLIHTLNPALVILGGEMAQAKPWISDAIEQVVQKHVMPNYRERVQLHFSYLGRDSAILGAATLITNKLFNSTRVSIR